MAAKVPIGLRLAPETLARVDAVASARGRSRQGVLEAAVDSFLVGAEGGVSELPAAEPSSVPAESHASVLSERQARLGREMGWSGGLPAGVKRGAG